MPVRQGQASAVLIVALLILALVVAVQILMVADQYVWSEVYPSRMELARRSVVFIRPGMAAGDLACLVGAPKSKEPGKQQGHVIWAYDSWPSVAAYAEVDRTGMVVAVYFLPT